MAESSERAGKTCCYYTTEKIKGSTFKVEMSKSAKRRKVAKMKYTNNGFNC